MTRINYSINNFCASCQALVEKVRHRCPDCGRIVRKQVRPAQQAKNRRHYERMKLAQLELGR